MSVAQFAEANFSRATGAGLDPHEYRRVTGRLAKLEEWPERFADVGRAHLARADRAASAVSAAEHCRAAARWFHFATLAPSRDRAQAAESAAASDRAMGRALALAEPAAKRIEGPGFAGWLRGPGGASTVVVIPGMDSGKEEFHDVCTALLRRGATVFAMDGPGQGVLAADTVIRADYHRVVGRVADALGADRIGLVGLSLGGYFAAESAARESRVAAAVTVSGPFRLDWDALPPFVTETLTDRAGSLDAARGFAGRVDLSGLAPRIEGPVLVIDGGRDVIPGVVNGAALARLAPRGEYLSIDEGDHLLGNVRADWLPAAADWLTARLQEA
ncbi:alpha/beta hydrolase [Glycomyces arizonensis]|uniref:alpha/beta hydrolase n=1 Tax=Glycomyces arizonensis TaxID=256035 RepID=UPI0003FE8117|nr:alpha/beta fold hydrolase [Glycomyces arizonensis]